MYVQYVTAVYVQYVTVVNVPYVTVVYVPHVTVVYVPYVTVAHIPYICKKILSSAYTRTQLKYIPVSSRSWNSDILQQLHKYEFRWETNLHICFIHSNDINVIPVYWGPLRYIWDVNKMRIYISFFYDLYYISPTGWWNKPRRVSVIYKNTYDVRCKKIYEGGRALQ